MSELSAAPIIDDADLADDTELAGNNPAAPGWLRITLAKLKLYLSAALVLVPSGGATGQVLKKTSNADGAFAWATDNSGGSIFDWTDYNPITPRRYWMIHIQASDNGNASGTQPHCIAELYLRDAAGNLIPGTWTASGSEYGPVSALTDGDINTFWGSSLATPALFFDAGAGNAVIPDKIEMRARNGYGYQAPGKFFLKSSPDASTYTTVTTLDKIANWASSERRKFRTRPYIVRLSLDQYGTPGYTTDTTTTVAEVELIGSNGADLTLPASASEDAAGSVFGTSAPANAFNNDTTDYWGAGGASAMPYLAEYRFATEPTTLTGITLTSRAGYASQAPGSFKVYYSRDGITYRVGYQPPMATTPWANGEKRTWLFNEVSERTPDTCRMFLAGAANSPAAAWAKVPIEYSDLASSSTIRDTQYAWDSTNKRYTPKKAGLYLVNGRVKTSTAGELRVAVAKNGTRHASVGAEGANISAAGGSLLVWCNGSTDYIELYCYTDTARAYVTTSGGNPMDTFLEIMGPL